MANLETTAGVIIDRVLTVLGGLKMEVINVKQNSSYDPTTSDTLLTTLASPFATGFASYNLATPVAASASVNTTTKVISITTASDPGAANSASLTVVVFGY